MRNTLFILILIFFEAFAVSQAKAGKKFVKCKLSLTDGSVKSGFIKVPKTALTVKLEFKEHLDAEVEEIKTLSVNSFTTYSDTGEEYNFECHFIDLKPKHVANLEQLKFKYTLLVAVKGHTTLYVTGNNYRTKKDGTVYVTSYNAGGEINAHSIYYIKKPNILFAEQFIITKVAVMPSISLNSPRKQLIKAMQKHLPECPELIESIKNKEVEPDLAIVIDLYNKFMSKGEFHIDLYDSVVPK